MPTGFELFQSAEMEHQFRGNSSAAMDLYVLSIERIVQHENPIAKFPVWMLTQITAQADDYPEQVLGAVWRNFVGFFKDPNMAFNKDSKPEAWKLLEAFRPGKVEVGGMENITGKFERFGRTDEGKVLLKGMQVTAGFTLGLLAWDRKDRATAAKRYKEALDLAATYTPFIDKGQARTPLERYVSSDVLTTTDNLRMLIRNDETNAEVLRDLAGMIGAATNPGRKAKVSMPNARIEKDGTIVQETNYTFATDACNVCGKRDVKLERCARCKKAWCKSIFRSRSRSPRLPVHFKLTRVADCGKECQLKDWKSV